MLVAGKLHTVVDYRHFQIKWHCCIDAISKPWMWVMLANGNKHMTFLPQKYGWKYVDTWPSFNIWAYSKTMGITMELIPPFAASTASILPESLSQIFDRDCGGLPIQSLVKSDIDVKWEGVLKVFSLVDVRAPAAQVLLKFFHINVAKHVFGFGVQRHCHEEVGLGPIVQWGETLMKRHAKTFASNLLATVLGWPTYGYDGYMFTNIWPYRVSNKKEWLTGILPETKASLPNIIVPGAPKQHSKI